MLELNLGRLKDREKIVLGFFAEIRLPVFIGGGCCREGPTDQFFREEVNLIFLVVIQWLLLIAVPLQLLIQITFALAAGSGHLPVDAQFCSDKVFVELEIQEHKPFAKGLEADNQHKQYG